MVNGGLITVVGEMTCSYKAIATIVTWTAADENVRSLAWRMNAVDCNIGGSRSSEQKRKTNKQILLDDEPACETESPASSINWSMEKPSCATRSASRAGASCADMVFQWSANTQYHKQHNLLLGWLAGWLTLYVLAMMDG